ncbi:hypothetical protein, partial [Gemmiger formicilis]|uniref:hypothetical protein n=1 Tax=Gemmiger formicilis TaxID=745368 RepID=UPI00195EB4B5
LALCLLCLLVVVGVCLVLTRCSSGPTGPEQANFGTTAALRPLRFGRRRRFVWPRHGFGSPFRAAVYFAFFSHS